MKKILLPLALMSALLVSCEKPVQEYYYIWIERRELHFALYGDEQSVIVESSHDWEVADYPDWCIPSIKSGQSGAEVTFTVTENDSESQREGEIIFSCGDAADSIIVLQDGLNDKINFADFRFKEKLCSVIGTEIDGQIVIIDIDKDNDGEISYKEASDAKCLYLDNPFDNEAVSMRELKYFSSLEYIYCVNCVSSIDLTNCLNLKYLNLSGVLTSLDVSKNTALESLECYFNQLTSLDLSKNTALKYLRCGGNQLTSLDLSNNTALTKLDCSNNQLTSLDVSKNTALTQLYCDNNQLTTLDVSKNTALTYLYCYFNQLKSLDVSKNTALESLECDFNQLTSLDLSNNTALTSLRCYDNQLTSLDLSNNTALELLYCYNNLLTSLDLCNNRLIEYLIIHGNPLQKLILYKYHHIIDNNIESIESEYGDIIEYVE